MISSLRQSCHSASFIAKLIVSGEHLRVPALCWYTPALSHGVAGRGLVQGHVPICGPAGCYWGVPKLILVQLGTGVIVHLKAGRISGIHSPTDVSLNNLAWKRLCCEEFVGNHTTIVVEGAVVPVGCSPDRPQYAGGREDRCGCTCALRLHSRDEELIPVDRRRIELIRCHHLSCTVRRGGQHSNLPTISRCESCADWDGICSRPDLRRRPRTWRARQRTGAVIASATTCGKCGDSHNG
jgi:hypothetical protein